MRLIAMHAMEVSVHQAETEDAKFQHSEPCKVTFYG